MRDAGLLVWKGKQVPIPNLTALEAAALLNSNSLHLEREGQNLDGNDP